ncbi:MAG: hypothetical protein GWN00_26485, partial [Aliifodinibius sp.]|nr:hypothetical protein [Fodinibius sp.]NIV14393.1 hypothetical protein [Fodinibius sp.]NIY28221.1 hypothetical protein [Fodinibius sp.]
DGDGVWDGEDAFPLDPELSEVTVQGVVKDNLVLSSDENVGVGQGTLIKGNVKGTSDNYIRLLPDVTVEGNFEGISKV